MEAYVDDIMQELKESILVKEQTLTLAPQIAKAAHAIVESYKGDGKLVVFGNGGSAADAQHIVAELVNKLYIDRKMLNALALTVNTSVLTAIGNDSSYDEVFSRQIESLVDKRDVIMAISTSGNSKNIIRGIEEGKKKGCFIIGMTGSHGGKMKDMCDVLVNIPSDDTPRIQESHITVGHIICGLVERELFS